MKLEMIAMLVLPAAIGCLALSIYKVKQWYARNDWTSDSDTREQEKINLRMIEQVMERESFLIPKPPSVRYTEISAPVKARGQREVKRILLLAMLFLIYGFAIYGVSENLSFNGATRLFLTVIFTGFLVYIAWRIIRRLYFCERVFLPKDSPGMVVNNFYWGRRLFSWRHFLRHQDCVSICHIERYEVRDDEIRVYGKFVYTGTDITIQSFNDKGLSIGRVFNEKEERQILDRLEMIRTRKAKENAANHG